MGRDPEMGIGMDLQVDKWNDCHLVEHWWNLMLESPNNPNQPLRTLVILVSWVRELNTRIFRRKASTPASILAKIKEEAEAWCKQDHLDSKSSEF